MKLLLIIGLVYLGLKVIGRFIFPMIFKRFVNKFEEKVRNQQGKQTASKNEKIGETVIDKKPSSAKESSKNVGEYVDYEEVD